MNKMKFPQAATKKERSINWPKIAEITDQDFGFSTPGNKTNTIRFCARAIITNNGGEICIIKAEVHNYYQLPGGGIEAGETIEQGLRREVQEEVGYLITDIEPLGYILEKREDIRNKHHWQHGLSYVFKALVTEQVGTNYMPDEIEEGFTPVWMSLDDAINKLEQREGHIESYSGNFSNRRDLAIAKYFQNQNQIQN